MVWTNNKAIEFFENNSCKRKKKYLLGEAFKNLLERRDRGSDINSIYKCIFCNNYHIGNIRKKTKYRRNKIMKLMGVLK